MARPSIKYPRVRYYNKLIQRSSSVWVLLRHPCSDLKHVVVGVAEEQAQLQALGTGIANIRESENIHCERAHIYSRYTYRQSCDGSSLLLVLLLT